MAIAAIEVRLYEPYDADQPQYTVLYSTTNPSDYDFAPGIIKDEVNKAGSFEFDIYPNHPDYKRIKSFYTYIGVIDTGQYGNEAVLFYGRIINFTIDIYGSKHAICEGLLANLLDCPAYMPTDDYNYVPTIKAKGTYWLFLYPINAYNDLLCRNDISFGGVDNAVQVTSSEEMEYANSMTNSCGDFITSLLDSFGGILEMTYYQQASRITGSLKWRTDPISEPSRFLLNDQVLKIGENIISVSFDDGDSSKIEGIIPYATYTNADGEEKYYYYTHNEPWTSHEVPNIMVSTGAYETNKTNRMYPVKVVEIENVSVNNGNISQSNFNMRAEKYARLHCRDYIDNVTVNAVDSYFIGQATRRIHIMDRVHVVVPYADYDETKYCLSYELDIVNPPNSQFTFGDYKPISSQNAYYISKHISAKNK